jgi:hypothetical protein
MTEGARPVTAVAYLAVLYGVVRRRAGGRDYRLRGHNRTKAVYI